MADPEQIAAAAASGAAEGAAEAAERQIEDENIAAAVEGANAAEARAQTLAEDLARAAVEGERGKMIENLQRETDEWRNRTAALESQLTETRTLSETLAAGQAAILDRLSALTPPPPPEKPPAPSQDPPIVDPASAGADDRKEPQTKPKQDEAPKRKIFWYR